MMFEVADVWVNGSLLALLGSGWLIVVSWSASRALAYLDEAFDRIAGRRNDH